MTDDVERDTGELPATPARPGALSVDDVAALLRGAPAVAPPSVTQRAVSRVRVESTAIALLRTLGGAWLEVGRALPDLLLPPEDRGVSARRPPSVADDELEDTGELPEGGA